MEFAHENFSGSGKKIGGFWELFKNREKSGRIVAKIYNSSACAASICRAL
jgi:hypothetical protein